MKRGFTLIELLAVIVILAIILVIAVPQINKIINKTKIDSFRSNEQMVITATKYFLNSNQDRLPTTIDEPKEVSLAELQSNNYIKEIKDSFSISNSCSGYVVIRKTEYDYDYTPYINCKEEISNSVDDGLVLHYAFDEKKEPVNATIDPLVISSIPTDTSGNNYTNWHFVTWAGYFHEKVQSEIDSNAYAIKITNNTSTTSTNDFWDIGWRDNTIVGNTYTFSFYAKGNGNIQIYSHWGALFSVNLTNTLQRYNVTFTRGGTASEYFWIRATNLQPGQWAQFEHFQVEKGNTMTDFINDYNTVYVKDNSIKNNNALLSAATYPTWTSDSKVGNGAYTFDGTNTYINAGHITDYDLTNKGSILLWAKSDISYPSDSTTTKYRGLISKTLGGSTGAQDYFIDWYGTNSMRYLRGGIGNSTTYIQVMFNDYNFNNEWHHIALTWNGTYLVLYSDGKEIKRINQTLNAQVTTDNLEIGRVFQGSTKWDGLIDDVRIYNRTLSSDEIKEIYDIQYIK